MPCSGRFILRVTPRLHARLRKASGRRNSSLNHLCIELLERGLAADNRGPWDELIEALRRSFGESLTGICLFGSRARGDAHEGSDVDLLAVLDDAVLINRRLYRTWDVQCPQLGPEEINVHFTHLPATGGPASSFWLEVAMDAKILFERQRSLSAAIAAVRQEIASGRYRRKTAHGQPYWLVG